MAREVSRWEAEERSIEAFEAETARLLSSLDSADSTHEEWQETDLEGEAKEAWNLANKTLASEAAWLEERKRSKSGATQISEQVKAVEAEIRRLAASSSSSLTEEVEGTQRDARFGELEFNVSFAAAAAAALSLALALWKADPCAFRWIGCTRSLIPTSSSPPSPLAT